MSDEVLRLEREAERNVLTAVLGALDRGIPSMVTISGAPGLGQLELLRWLARLAAGQGVRVLWARASPAEHALRYGVVAQLLAPLVPRAREVLAGTEQLPGLAELLRKARTRPTMMIVEDAQWLDPASSVWLQALMRRLPGTRIAMLASTGGTCGDSAGDEYSVTNLVPDGQVNAVELMLSPLSARGVADAVELVYGVPGEPEFCAAALAATGGNPWLLRKVLGEFRDRGGQPMTAGVPRLRAIGEAALGEYTTRVVDGLSEEAMSVLRAIAVCGDVLDFPLVCRLAGEPHLHESRIRSIIASSGLTVNSGERLRVRAPVVAARVLESMPGPERAELHARAAELAYRADVRDDDVARILLCAGPIGTQWVVHLLRRSFVAALRNGEDGLAVAYLNRALDEPLDPLSRAKLSFELASVQVARVPVASDRRLTELASTPGPEFAGLRVRAVDAKLSRGDSHWARRVAAEAVLAEHESEKDAMLALYWLSEQTRQDDGEPMVPEMPSLPDHPLDTAQAGARAWQLAASANDLQATRVLARRALRREDSRPLLVMPRLSACRALFLTDDLEEAEVQLNALLADVQREHLRAGTARVLVARAELGMRTGRNDAAERDLAAAERALPLSGWHPNLASYPTSLQLCIDVQYGRLDRARKLAARESPAEGAFSAYFMFARALLALAEGRPVDALDMFRECGRRLLRQNIVNPGLLPWRSVAAGAAAALGHIKEAQRLSLEEWTLAEKWGAPSALGWAEMGFSRLSGEHRVVRAREALRVLRGYRLSPVYTLALLEVAAAELEDGDPAAAPPLLAEAAALATIHRSHWLSARLRELSERAGTKPAAPVSPIWTSLSEPERKVAVMVARGRVNGEIAETLSVTKRTVERRLSCVYRKLGISGREELGALVRSMEGF
ncbi:helix-turn-helix transcriptional regulator [Amycolatopsis magusensis]|uniref:helix-turn-helix transcriptional regulator n=1 Tax=Amycolatopsis magusensis TaxID=882444 RepID=UPI00378B98DB